MPRRILVTGGSDGALQLIETPADSEYELQTVLLNNAQLIPSEDLGLDDDLLVVGRETSLASGSVDLLCISRSGELVIVEFKTGPQNPDFRHALAQVIDYGSDLWELSRIEFDEGVVHRYLSGRHVDPALKDARSLQDAATRAWSLSDESWSALAMRLDQVLSTGDFHFVVAAQRFTEAMHDSARYLNETTRFGKYFLVEIIRLDGAGQKAYAAQVVERPKTRSSATGSMQRATEAEFLARIPDPMYREAMSELFSTVAALGLVLAWYTKGASIRLKSPDRAEPISIGWVFLDGGQWYGAKHVTLGVDPATLKNHPTVAPAILTLCESVSSVPGAVTTPGTLRASTFEPGVFPIVRSQLLSLLSDFKSSADAAVPRAGASTP